MSTAQKRTYWLTISPQHPHPSTTSDATSHLQPLSRARLRPSAAPWATQPSSSTTPAFARQDHPHNHRARPPPHLQRQHALALLPRAGVPAVHGPRQPRHGGHRRLRGRLHHRATDGRLQRVEGRSASVPRGAERGADDAIQRAESAHRGHVPGLHAHAAVRGLRGRRQARQLRAAARNGRRGDCESGAGGSQQAFDVAGRRLVYLAEAAGVADLDAVWAPEAAGEAYEEVEGAAGRAAE